MRPIAITATAWGGGFRKKSCEVSLVLCGFLIAGAITTLGRVEALGLQGIDGAASYTTGPHFFAIPMMSRVTDKIRPKAAGR